MIYNMGSKLDDLNESGMFNMYQYPMECFQIYFYIARKVRSVIFFLVISSFIFLTNLHHNYL